MQANMQQHHCSRFHQLNIHDCLTWLNVLQMDTPEGFVWSTRGWDLAVAILVLAFMCGLRSVEVLRMSCCDIRWNDKGAEVAVNRTKNDQGGHKRTSFLEYAEKRELCGLRYLRRFMVSYGYMLPRPGCTNSSHPTLECLVCPRLFENVPRTGCRCSSNQYTF